MSGTGTRRPRRTLVLGCLLLTLVAACTEGGTDSPSPTAGTQAPGPIIVASGLDVTGSGGVRQQLIAEWNRQHEDEPALRAQLVELPGGADQQRSQLLGALQSGSAAYDLVNLDVTWIPEFAEAGLIQALPGPDVEDPDVIPEVLSTTRWKSRTYALPFNTDVGLLYYRKDLIEQSGINENRQPTGDWSWRNLYDSIATLGSAEPDGDEPEKGWTTQLAPYEGLTVNVMDAFAAVDVQLASADGRYTATPDTLKKGLQEFLTHVDDNRTLRPRALTSNEDATLDDFAQGRVAYMRNWPYAFGALQSRLAPEQYAVVPLPGRSVLGGQNLAVSAASPRSAAARELLAFLTGPRSERCLLDAGFAATRLSSYSSEKTGSPTCWEAVTEALRPGTASGDPAAREGSARIPSARERSEYIGSIRRALEEAVQRPRTPYYGAFTRALQSTVHGLLTEESPDLDAAAEALDEALKEAFAGR
ncbi:extracellular solute-binding protein [Streptomyces sp. MBT56]|uniref:extracellular solute-binding protein n=1 Tax=unclassified Streptomyces TaxID=2593676 RepID=UPI00190D1CAD|nr:MULTISPECIES: extracellular solute-binding protein [unclassified Streptomyces]MBK3561247.1 extracellular solute-binding protein [Streptomyces sp. MBT56]MBK3604204.1 extracellular solute-binding protein [Streptomyces sp. MBT54]MBK3616476.1 extracellular solute-binding protein [Streptomyces sp. MBT98]